MVDGTYRTHQTTKSGAYTFADLPTFVEENGKLYLAGYQVILQTLPTDYAATKYWNDADPDVVYSKLAVADSDTVEDSQQTGSLPITVQKNRHEMLILAQEATAGTQNAPAESYVDYNWAFICETNIPNIDTPDQAEKKYYDLVKARDYANLDAGLKQRETATVQGIVWEDTDYNGIQDAAEKGKSGVSVTLEQYYYDPASKQYVKTDSDRTATTNKNGIYTFANVPTHLIVGTTDCLAYYRICAKLPNGYAVTRYQQATDDTAIDSDWIAETNYLTAPDHGDYFLVAQESRGNTPYDLTDAVTQKQYDSILKKDSINQYNGGLKQFETANIQGIVWLDQNYDGLKNIGETAMETAQTVYLDQYYLDENQQWQLYQTLSAQTNAKTGMYQFQNQPTYLSVDGEIYLAGYRLRMQAVPDGFAVTKYQVLDLTGISINSDLLAQTQESHADHTVDFQEAGDYILLAKQAVHGNTGSGEVGFHTYYVRTYDNVQYDIVTAKETVTDYNGGLKAIQTAMLKGIVWEDVNYDGVLDETESGYGNLHLTLCQFYWDGTAWQETDTTQTATTDASGVYQFDAIPTYIEVDGTCYLAGYKLHLDALPDGYAVTVLANDN
ncbi:MAG: SdrD B-like domain-containing protein, partial [Ruminococcus sp.]